jgi:L-alanine-DL-glutamate epimerase-like enolase superfamily enzyme
MNIEKIECLQLRAPNVNPADCDGSAETAVIRVTADNGVSGVGETDAPPNVIAALLEMPSAHIWNLSIADLLLRENPLEVERLWEKVYEGTIYQARRGVGIMLLAAIDIALHDLRGKVLGLPAYQLLGGAARKEITPYLTLFPSMPQGRSWSQMKEACCHLMRRAVSAGYRAAKMEMLFDKVATDRELIELAYECRKIAGDDMDLMIDVGYRWRNFNVALFALRALEDANLFFVEAPLHTDDLDGLARLADGTLTPVAVGELLQTRHEFRELIERGHCDVIQPDIGRVGGLTEAVRCAKTAADRGLYCIPHAWKTGITVAATRHFAAAVSNCPYSEFCHHDFFPSFLRERLAEPEIEVRKGRWELPDQPGLGIELSEDTIARCLSRPITVIGGSSTDHDRGARSVGQSEVVF